MQTYRDGDKFNTLQNKSDHFSKSVKHKHFI